MPLPKRLNPEKTTYLTIGSNVVPISMFPEYITQEFEVLERMKLDAADLTYKLEILALAIKCKGQDLTSLIQTYMAKSKPATEETVSQPETTPEQDK